MKGNIKLVDLLRLAIREKIGINGEHGQYLLSYAKQLPYFENADEYKDYMQNNTSYHDDETYWQLRIALALMMHSAVLSRGNSEEAGLGLLRFPSMIDFAGHYLQRSLDSDYRMYQQKSQLTDEHLTIAFQKALSLHNMLCTPIIDEEVTHKGQTMKLSTALAKIEKVIKTIYTPTFDRYTTSVFRANSRMALFYPVYVDIISGYGNNKLLDISEIVDIYRQTAYETELHLTKDVEMVYNNCIRKSCMTDSDGEAKEEMLTYPIFKENYILYTKREDGMMLSRALVYKYNDKIIIDRIYDSPYGLLQEICETNVGNTISVINDMTGEKEDLYIKAVRKGDRHYFEYFIMPNNQIRKSMTLRKTIDWDVVKEYYTQHEQRRLYYADTFGLYAVIKSKTEAAKYIYTVAQPRNTEVRLLTFTGDMRNVLSQISIKDDHGNSVMSEDQIVIDWSGSRLARFKAVALKRADIPEIQIWNMADVGTGYLYSHTQYEGFPLYLHENLFVMCYKDTTSQRIPYPIEQASVVFFKNKTTHLGLYPFQEAITPNTTVFDYITAELTEEYLEAGDFHQASPIYRYKWVIQDAFKDRCYIKNGVPTDYGYCFEDDCVLINGKYIPKIIHECIGGSNV